jgi:hypothetical protein
MAKVTKLNDRRQWLDELRRLAESRKMTIPEYLESLMSAGRDWERKRAEIVEILIEGEV